MPSSFCTSSLSFARLDLTHNKFNGSIPVTLGKCSALRVLKSRYNSPSGPLPDELFNASSLEYLSFSNNGLHGVLDGARIINLKNLCHLDLGNNMLTGKIPDSIGQLKRLQELHLCRNQMSGELPSAVSNCTDLVTHYRNCTDLVTHYRNRGLCREPDPLGTGLFALGTACAERELSAERSRQRWAGTGGSAESHGPNSRHSCTEGPLSSRNRPIHN
jgi:hypothetical protein